MLVAIKHECNIHMHLKKCIQSSSLLKILSEGGMGRNWPKYSYLKLSSYIRMLRNGPRSAEQLLNCRFVIDLLSLKVKVNHVRSLLRVCSAEHVHCIQQIFIQKQQFFVFLCCRHKMILVHHILRHNVTHAVSTFAHYLEIVISFTQIAWLIILGIMKNKCEYSVSVLISQSVIIYRYLLNGNCD